MALKYDSEFWDAFAPMVPAITGARPAIYDVQARRDIISALLSTNTSPSPDVDGLLTTYYAESSNGHKVAVIAILPPNEKEKAPTSAIVYIHGGGMILGSAAGSARRLALQVKEIGNPHFSVEYRLAPEAQNTTPVEDCWAALLWLKDHAALFNIDPTRIGVRGDSSGGGIAAGLVLMARDRKLDPPLAKQILICPMLDDRNATPNPHLEKFPLLWNIEDNITGGSALLGKDRAGDPNADISEYASPARAKSVSGLPSTYIECGGCDYFAKEDIVYASRLVAEDIEVEFHLYPGLPHAAEDFAPEIDVIKKSKSNIKKASLSF
jgi:acetyl esterase/lipase